MILGNKMNDRAISGVANIIHRSFDTRDEVQTYLCAYLVHTIKSGSRGFTTPEDAIACAADGDDLIESALRKATAGIDSEGIEEMLGRIDAGALEAFLAAGLKPGSAMNGAHFTPDCITDLALRILDVKPGDKLVDYGCGAGGFLERAAELGAGAHSEGVEIVPSFVAAARVRARITGSRVAYSEGDMFSYYEDSVGTRGADKVFSNYPWGMRTKKLRSDSGFVGRALQGLPEYGRPVSSDWVFNRLLVDSVDPAAGTAVGISSNGALFNGADARIRKYFIENGWIRAVVALPEGLFFPWTNIGTALIVFGGGSTSAVRLVDATDLGTKERRGSTLGEDAIDEIIRRLENDGERSSSVSISELAGHGYSLLVSQYFEEAIEIENAVELGSLALDIRRGAGIGASALDAISCTEDTGVDYLNLSNVADGAIEGELQHIGKLDGGLERGYVATGDLLVSKSGSPFRIAVAEVADGRKLIASGNFFIIRLDAQRADPYYVASFLSSPRGARLLEAASRGTTLRALSLGALRGMPVPLVDLDAQRRVGTAYRAKLDEIGILKMRLERARAEITDLFDMEA